MLGSHSQLRFIHHGDGFLPASVEFGSVGGGGNLHKNIIFPNICNLAVSKRGTTFFCRQAVSCGVHGSDASRSAVSQVPSRRAICSSLLSTLFMRDEPQLTGNHLITFKSMASILRERERVTVS